MAVLLTAILLLSAVVLPASAESSGKCGNISWSVENGILSLKGSGNIPDFSETAMAPWYENREQIFSVSIGKDITGIGAMAFYGLTEVNYISLPSKVTAIGNFAFAGCTGLVGAELNEGLKSIGSDAFNRCENLAYVTLPATLTKIGNQAFYLCSSLSVISIPSGVTELGTGVFGYCTSLVKASVECKISELPAWTFLGCESLKEVSMSSAITEVGENSFYHCEKLGNVYYEGETSVGNTIEQQIKNDIPEFNGVKKGDDSNLSDNYEQEDNVIAEDGTVTETSREVVITDNNAIVEIKSEYIKPVDGSNETYELEIDAVVNSKDDWIGFEEIVSKQVAYAERVSDNNTNVKKVNVNIYKYFDGEIPEEVLKSFAGKNAVLNVYSSDNTTISIDCSRMEEATAKDYNLKYSLTKNNEPTKAQKALIGDADSYLIEFEEGCSVSVAVKVRLGITYARNVATIYQKNVMKDWELLQSVMVDDYGYAEFYLDGVDSHTDYMIALNVEGIDSDSVILPDSIASEYGVLIDEFGNKYVVSGTKSSWGITFGQLTLILVGIIVVSAVIIGIIVRLCFKHKQKKTVKSRRIHEKNI